MPVGRAAGRLHSMRHKGKDLTRYHNWEYIPNYDIAYYLQLRLTLLIGNGACSES
jgi:hypothetical protein